MSGRRCESQAKAMPNWNFVKRQLKFDEPIGRPTYSQKHTNRNRKHTCFTTKTINHLYN